MTFKISESKHVVALDFANWLKELIAEKTIVHVALSGGSTPKVVFDELAANFKTDIDWSKVHLYWGDERCVEPSDEQSNYRMTKAHLLSKIEIPDKNIHRIHGENEPNYEANRYSDFLEKGLPKFDEIPRFDLIILGIGDDGHTASIFPDEIELWNSKKYCEVAKHPESGQKRISLTGQIINNAQQVVFLATGANKAQKISEIISKKESAKKYPASLVAPKNGKLIWFLDKAAAESIA